MTMRKRAVTQQPTALNYLVMEERDREERSHEETPRTRNKRLALIQEKKRIEAARMDRVASQQTDADSPADSRRTTTVLEFDEPRVGYNRDSVAGIGGGVPAREDQQYSREEAWYLLRALVGQELKNEQGLLWKLENLDPREDMASYTDA